MIRPNPHHLTLLQPVMDGLLVLLLYALSACHPEPAAAKALASGPVAGYSGSATPHCVVELGGSESIGAQPRSSGFLCVLHPVRVMTGCAGASQDAPVPIAGPPTLYSLSPDAWRLLVTVYPHQ